MKLEEHCKESILLFGESYIQVHKWLDEFAGKLGIGMKHRCYRHHEAGIKQVNDLWGEKAAMAARKHIISDLQQEGWTIDDHFPRDTEDYLKMGLY